MTQTMPGPIKVSICCSVLNQSEWLKEMIQSVVAQSFPEWELIIVDDGSTDDISAVVNGFGDKRIRLFRFDENKGIPYGPNAAFKFAIGEYASWLAADETISPDKLKEQVEYLEAHPGVDAVWGLPTYFNGQRLTDLRWGRRPEWEQHALRAHNRSNEAWMRTLLELESVPLGTCSMLAKRSVLQALGQMDEELTMFSDHELYCRFFEKGYTGIVLPYRWAVDKEYMPEESVRVRNQNRSQYEFDRVRSLHKIVEPKKDGKITVGIPCYNHAHFLVDAVNSVLAQTRPVDEILILDDASTDDFKTVAQQFTDPRIKLMAFPENMGCQEAKNQMAFRAEGDFFVVLSADDTLAPSFVEKCMAKFAENPWLEFVASHTDFMAEDGSDFPDKKHAVYSIPVPTNRSREDWIAILRQGNLYFGAGIYRTKVISDLGGWRKDIKIIDDYEMYLKLLQRENIGIVEEVLTHTRLHGKNKSVGMSKEDSEALPWMYHEAKKPYYQQLMRVVIATPFYEVKAFSPYIVSLVETIRLLGMVGIDWRFMELSGDSYVHRARNTICDRFLEDPDATDLFFIDSDMSWNPDAFVKMCMLPDGIVAGSYPVKNGWDKWTSIPKMTESEGAYHYRGRELGDGTALLEAHVVAGGFLRIKRHILEKFREFHKELWYMEPSTDPSKPQRHYTEFFAAEKIPEDKLFYGEDHMFSKRIREMGAPMFIYPNATISHYGMQAWTGNLDKFLKEKKWDQDKPQQAAV